MISSLVPFLWRWYDVNGIEVTRAKSLGNCYRKVPLNILEYLIVRPLLLRGIVI